MAIGDWSAEPAPASVRPVRPLERACDALDLGAALLELAADVRHENPRIARRVEPELRAPSPDARGGGRVARGQLEQLVQVFPSGCRRACDQGPLALAVALADRRGDPIEAQEQRPPERGQRTRIASGARARRFLPEHPARGQVAIEHPLERLALARHPGALVAQFAQRGLGQLRRRGQALDEPGHRRQDTIGELIEVLAGSGDVTRNRIGDRAKRRFRPRQQARV